MIRYSNDTKKTWLIVFQCLVFVFGFIRLQAHNLLVILDCVAFIWNPTIFRDVLLVFVLHLLVLITSKLSKISSVLSSKVDAVSLFVNFHSVFE